MSLSGVQPQLRMHSRPDKVGGRRAIFRYHQEIKRGSGIILHGGSGTKMSLTQSSASCIVSRIPCDTPKINPQTPVRVPPIRVEVGRFRQKRTCPGHDPCSYPSTIVRSVCKPSPYAMLSKITCRHTPIVNSTASSSRTCGHALV